MCVVFETFVRRLPISQPQTLEDLGVRNLEGFSGICSSASWVMECCSAVAILLLRGRNALNAGSIEKENCGTTMWGRRLVQLHKRFVPVFFNSFAPISLWEFHTVSSLHFQELNNLLTSILRSVHQKRRSQGNAQLLMPTFVCKTRAGNAAAHRMCESLWGHDERQLLKFNNCPRTLIPMTFVSGHCSRQRRRVLSSLWSLKRIFIRRPCYGWPASTSITTFPEPA